VLDGAEHVGRCLEALRAQSHPAEHTELIVVDNGSVDETRGRVRDHDVTLLVERSRRSPYAARNAGLAQATGDVVAFTDSDCVPAKDWLERGLACLEHEAADLIAGQVSFSYRRRPRAAELLDAITNLDQARSVAQRGVAKTGNLFVARRVFDEIGRFDDRRRSGGDVSFTARATGAGFTLLYADDAVVEKPARSSWALARKQYRVGRGEILTWNEAGLERRHMARGILRSLLPVHPRYIRERLAARGPGAAERRLLAVWLCSWWIGLIQTGGRLRQWLAGGSP
jgi:glycosyltransferase involved in cell wall biosynthesis